MIEILFFPDSDPNFAAARAIRHEVFVVEQCCPEDEEWDGFDSVSTHALALLDGRPAGTLRYFDDAGWFHIGRLAVPVAERGQGIAVALMHAAMREATARRFPRAFLNAQIDKLGFYRRFGFSPVGKEFTEANIRHKRMEATLS